MSKAPLHVILCTDDIEPDAMRRRSDFQPLAIDGGKLTNDAPVDHAPWADLLELFNLSLLVSHASYLACLASIAALEPKEGAHRLD